MRIVGLTGPKGSGKDTAADILIKNKKAKGRISFAGPLKEICSKVFEIPMETLTDPVLKEKPFVEMKRFGAPITLTAAKLKAVKRECASRLPEYDDKTGFMKYNVDRVSVNGIEGMQMESPRQLMQVIGTEFIRERIYKSWHMEAAFAEVALSKLDQTKTYCVTDARFVNEYEFLKAKFGDDFECYYVERPSQEEVLAKATHPSELGVKEIRAAIGEDRVLKNDGTMDEFEAKLLKLQEPTGSSKASTKRGSKFVYGPGKG